MYLNQKSLWNPVATPAVNNPYGDFTYREAVEIKVRRQEHVEEVNLKDGTVHYTRHVYYTLADVHVDDKLDGELVVNMYDMRTLAGHKKLRRLLTI